METNSKTYNIINHHTYLNLNDNETQIISSTDEASYIEFTNGEEFNQLDPSFHIVNNNTQPDNLLDYDSIIGYLQTTTTTTTPNILTIMNNSFNTINNTTTISTLSTVDSGTYYETNNYYNFYQFPPEPEPEPESQPEPEPEPEPESQPEPEPESEEDPNYTQPEPEPEPEPQPEPEPEPEPEPQPEPEPEPEPPYASSFFTVLADFRHDANLVEGSAEDF